jgi:uncharacterized protein YdhG (YjbR/CyaY superfamily)
MPSKAADVDSYIAEAAPERAEALTRIRDLARHTLVGFDEVMAYGMPTYSRDGQGAFAFANQKAHVSLYFLSPAVVEAHAAALAGQDMGKSCLRFRKPAAIDYALVEQLLTATRDAAAAG